MASASSASGCSSRKACPALSTTSVTNFGASPGLAASVLGRSSLMELASSGAVRIKITTSTSITSTSGVTLISLIGAELSVRSKRPKDIRTSIRSNWQHRLAGNQLPQIARKPFQRNLNATDHAPQHVVSQYRRCLLYTSDAAEE